MGIFLEKFNLPRLNQEEIEIMSNPVTSTEIEAMISQRTKAEDQTREMYQTFREVLMLFLLKFFQKVSEEGTLPNSLYKVTITLIPKLDKDNTQKRKQQANITDEHRCKIPQQNFSQENSVTHQKANTP